MVALRSPTGSPHLYLRRPLDDVKQHPKVLMAFPFACLLALLYFMYVPVRPLFHTTSSNLAQDGGSIRNATLGFQEIYVLALPERKDRVQPMIAAANATNTTIITIGAVRDKEIPRETWPIHWKEGNHKTGELGCLVSHIRIWDTMVENDVTSAVILESDADWDLRIRDILQGFPPAISALTDFISWPSLTPRESYPPTHENPYGLDWDILWMGHCGSNAEGQGRVYNWNDTTVPPPKKLFVFDIGLLPNQYIPGTRAMYQFARTTCSTGYAVTQQGARKLAHYFQSADSNLDIALSEICTKHPDLVCLGVWPQIFTNAVSASNIDHTAHGDKPLERSEQFAREGMAAAGPALQFSARANAKAVLEGKGIDQYTAQWETMWAPGDYEEEKKGGLGSGEWVLQPLDRSQAFGM